MTATVTLSMEIELAWGHHAFREDHSYLSPNREKETETLLAFLDACDRHDIPVSFSVVGYLLHEAYEPLVDSPHAPDWLPVGPGSNVETHPAFYAPDLVREVASRPTRHDIGTQPAGPGSIFVRP